MTAASPTILLIDDNESIIQDYITSLSNFENHSDSLKKLKNNFLGRTSNKQSENCEFNSTGVEHLNYNFITASQGQDGIDKFISAKKNHNDISVAIIDIRMPPGIDGVETTRGLWSLDPDVQVIIITAFSDYSWRDIVEQTHCKDNLAILKKPIDTVELRQMMYLMVRKWQIAKENQSRQVQLYNADKKLQTSEKKYRELFESVPVGFVQLNQDGEIEEVNNSLIELLGLSKQQLLGTTFESHIASNYQNFYSNHLKKLLQTKQQQVCSLQLTTQENNNHYLHIISNLSKNVVNQGVIINSSITDISNLKEAQDLLEYQAHHDSLTGLQNRIKLENELQKLISLSKRQQQKFSILFIDIDNFKEINDTHGHQFGDKFLIAVTRLLNQCCRIEDTLFRIGGDEFVIVLPHTYETTDIGHFCTRLIKLANNGITINKHEFIVSCSIGITVYPDNGDSDSELLRKADIAMYKAKDNGKNNFVIFSSSINNNFIYQLGMRDALAEAIEKNSITIVYQPKYDITNKNIFKIEALSRWRYEDNNVSPEIFIALAEKTGLIYQFGIVAIQKSLEHLVYWQAKDFYPTVAINVSPIQLKNVKIITDIQELLDRYKIDPNCIDIEITENVFIDDIDTTIVRLKQLNEIGVSITLDDFGTGFSSLAYLKSLPFSTIKIDKSFVDGIPDNETDTALCQTIVDVSKNLHLGLVAEGVETQEQLECLKVMGCNCFQGYLISRPLDFDKIDKFMLTDYQKLFSDSQ